MACSSTASRLNILPGVWGPHAWSFLYSIALGYPNTPSSQEKQSMKSFMVAMRDVLPCAKCRSNFTDKLNGEFGQRLDAALDCSETLVKYVYDLESAVADSNGKTVCNMNDAIKDAMAVPKRPKSQSSSMTALWVLLPLMVIVSVVVTWLVTKKVVRRS